MLGPGRYLLGVVELIWLVGFAWVGAARVRRRLLSEVGGEAGFLATAVVTIALLIWVAELLGTVSAFKPVPYLIAMAVVGMVLRFGVPSAGGAPVFTASQKFVSDLTATHTIAATSAALSGKPVTNGVADASDFAPAFSSVAANANNHVLVLIQSSAVTGGADVAATAQRLVGWYDTGTNLPIVPNGGDVNITHDNGANKIFKL